MKNRIKIGILMTTAFFSLAAQAEQSMCDMVTQAVMANPSTPAAVSKSGIEFTLVAKLKNGFKFYGESGLDIWSNQVVPWDSEKADLLVAFRGQEGDFFFPNNIADKDNSSQEEHLADSEGRKCAYQDIKTKKCDGTLRAGYVEMTPPQDPSKDGILCPPDQESYKPHWLAVKANTTYCIRSRRGTSYALLEVREICGDSIVFQVVPGTNGSNKFLPKSSNPSLKLN